MIAEPDSTVHDIMPLDEGTVLSHFSSRSASSTLAALTTLALLTPVSPAFGQTATDPRPLTVVNDPSTPSTTQDPVEVPPRIDISRTLVDHGQTVDLRVFGPVGATVQLFGNGRLLREAVLEQVEGDQSGVASWTLQPGNRTRFHAVVDGISSADVTVQVRRTVTIGISQTNGIYTFSGHVARAEAGLQVTVARLDSQTKRVTGVASTRTDAAGRYTIRTALPTGLAGYYALTGVNASALEPGRSRLYGLVVPARAVVRPAPPTLVSPTVTIGARAAGGSVYTLSGRVTPGRSVPVTLAEIRSGRLVGVVGGRASSNGSYSFNVTLNGEANQTTRTFQVLTAAGQGLRAARSRPYGLIVPARPVVVRPATETAGQRNARLKAAEYLSVLAFSRSGLIRQLEQFEGFSRADATYGTDAQRANWSAQAARKAREYLDVLAFSRDGLIRQLVDFEGFTRAEAVYGVGQVGL